MTFASWVEKHGPEITSALAIAGALVLWLLPAETSCHTTSIGTYACATVSLAASLHSAWLAALLLTASVAFCLIPYLASASAAAQFGWSGLVLLFYLLSFGVDWTILPAAATGIVTGVFMLIARRPPPDEAAFEDVWAVPDKVPPFEEGDGMPPSPPPPDSEGPASPPEDGGQGAV